MAVHHHVSGYINKTRARTLDGFLDVSQGTECIHPEISGTQPPVSPPLRQFANAARDARQPFGDDGADPAGERNGSANEVSPPPLCS